MSHLYYAKGVPVDGGPDAKYSLVEPGPVTRHVRVQQVPVTPDFITAIDLLPDFEGAGFQLPHEGIEFALPAGHGLHATVGQPDQVERLEVLVSHH